MSHSISIRQREILEGIRLNGFLTSREIAQRWKISVGTARRDVDRLSGFDVVRSHGGGMMRSLSPAPLDGLDAVDRTVLERAFLFAQSGMSLGLCAGAHDVALARLLAEVDRISIVTNSIRSAQVLWGLRSQHRSEIQVVLTPGQVNDSGELVGSLATRAIRSLTFDITFAESRETTDMFDAFRDSSNRLVILDELRESDVRQLPRLSASYKSIPSVSIAT